MEWIKKAWRGQERCWMVFWVYGVLGCIAWNILSAALLNAGLLASPGAQITHLGIYLVYMFWVLVSEYRCAFNLEWRFWGYVVRVLVLLVPTIFVISLLFGGLLKGRELIHNAQCVKMRTDLQYRSQHMDVYQKCLQQQETPAPVLPSPEKKAE